MTQIQTTDNKGIHLTFENGLTLSIQWGAGNYGDNYNPAIMDSIGKEVPASSKVEIAIWDADKTWLEFPNGKTVCGYVSVDKVLDIIAAIRKTDLDIETAYPIVVVNLDN